MRLEIEQHTPQWHDYRKSHVMATDAHYILSGQTERLWRIKMGLDKVFVTQAMRDGSNMEELARCAYEEHTQKIVVPCVYQHDTNPWMAASLDGYGILEYSAVEIKCGKKTYELAKKGVIPPQYRAQMQHQIEVLGLDKIDYWCFDGIEGILIEIPRDNDFIVNMVAKEEEFYRYLQDLTPPPSRYHYRDDEEWEKVNKDWKHVNSQLRDLSIKEKELRNQILTISQNQDSIGKYAKVSFRERKGMIDYKSIPELENIDLEKWRKPSIKFMELEEIE